MSNNAITKAKLDLYARENPDFLKRFEERGRTPEEEAIIREHARAVQKDCTCLAEGCGKVRVARGMCSAHYQRWYRGGLKHPERCTVQGCEGEHYGRGRCQKHYMREYRRKKRRTQEMIEALEELT